MGAARLVYYENKHFVINGRKTFLYGAECHYFRLDPDQWSDRLQKIKDAGFNLVSTYVPWIWHEPVEGQIDLVGLTHPRRNLREFLDMCNEYGMYAVVRPGPYVMSELKNEGIPHWLLDEYPEIIAHTPSGEPHPTRVVSYLHPLYLEFVEKWYREVSRIVQPRLITNGGPIIMFQLDNEIGMLHWVTNTGDNHPHTLKRFAEFDRSKQEKRPLTELAKHWAWAEFARQEAAEYVRVLAQLARRNGIDVPFIVNVHGFKDFSVYSRGVDYPIGLSQLRDAARVDDVVLAGDFYPGKIGYDNFHDLILSSALTDALAQPEQPLFSAEFQSGRLSDRPRVSPSDVDLITRLCVANGMNALNYYMYCGGDNVEGIGLFGRRHEWQAPIASNGDLRPSYAVTSYLGQLLHTFGDTLCEAPKLVDTFIGFYSPYYATEIVNREDADVRRVIGDIESERENMHFDGVWRLLSAANIAYGAVDVQKSDIDVKKYPTLWMATTKYMDCVTQGKLVRYIRDGGQVVIGPQVPRYDMNEEPCDILAQAVGAVEVGSKGGYQRVNICGLESVFCRHYTVFDKPEDAQLIAFSEQGQREALAYRRKLGLGQVVVLGVGMSYEYQYQLEVISRLAKLIGVHARLSVSDASVCVSERAGKNGSLISVLNVDDTARSTHVFRSKTDLFGGSSVSLRPRSGKLLPVQFHVAEDVTIDYSNVELLRIEDDRIIKMDIYVPAGETGAIALTLGEQVSLEDPSVSAVETLKHDRNACAEVVKQGKQHVVHIPENSTDALWTLHIVRQESAVGMEAGQ
ncbi:beta-galactosidase [Alicyclobacillus sp. ALC3]|uniref:beta-galactosidase n=1 Tax=Alicyclobacillus sp. ALC3 TaxID=2796143 RepID=UPI002377D386|nr:beta-galactosidase [Alicyclobacillus sp. ALC3]WDL96100.1 beta-galactosidase [Alicyclobacillus sp. ALC3]